ncbi:hypothetical protein AWB80_07511 [Caballeronia pedi]|uniref:Uncharacterized protein n=1 Tax=Caballeronia pedi TaxID=1777141 RepID=A0A158DV46_9BURK|nr:hypothetical protein [Caballeronia pedi]SAK98403.1 hypothetical protein AWB80_07511 [Caballeronia pedi]
MIRWLRERIAWLVAGQDLAELERWRTSCAEAQRWLSEFPDAFTALGHVRGEAAGLGGNISWIRDVMRKRRDAKPLVIALENATPEAVKRFKTDWDVAMQSARGDRVAYKFLSPGCESRS